MMKVKQARLPKTAYDELALDRLREKAESDKEFVRCEGTDNYGQCIRHVSWVQQEYSKSKYGQILCWLHQREIDEGR